MMRAQTCDGHRFAQIPAVQPEGPSLMRPSCVLLPEAPTGGVLVTGSDLLFFLPFLRKKILIQNFFLVYKYLLEVYLLTPIVVH